MAGKREREKLWLSIVLNNQTPKYRGLYSNAQSDRGPMPKWPGS